MQRCLHETWVDTLLQDHNMNKAPEVDTYNLKVDTSSLETPALEHLVWTLSYIGGIISYFSFFLNIRSLYYS
jgi:hypothetical protein